MLCKWFASKKEEIKQEQESKSDFDMRSYIIQELNKRLLLGVNVEFTYNGITYAFDGEAKDKVSLIKIEEDAIKRLDGVLHIDWVDTIGEYAFEFSESLREFYSNSVQIVHAYAFWRCNNLVIFYAPMVQTIDEFAFSETRLSDCFRFMTRLISGVSVHVPLWVA